MYSKELTERRNEALKHSKELLETQSHLTIRKDQVKMLVYGPDQRYFKQKHENNITKF